MKKKKKIYESIRKETAPPTRVFKTRKDELPRKAKHKGKDLTNLPERDKMGLNE